MIEIMTPPAPSICPTAPIISQFIAVYSSGDSTNPNAERPPEQTGEGGSHCLRSPPARNQQVTKCVRLRCVTGMCRNSTGNSAKSQEGTLVLILRASSGLSSCTNKTGDISENLVTRGGVNSSVLEGSDFTIFINTSFANAVKAL